MKLRAEISGEFLRHEYLEGSERVNSETMAEFSRLRKGYSEWEKKSENFRNEAEEKSAFDIEVNRYATALKTLSECLMQYHGKKVIILLDEYDVPLENAYYSGFYDQMVGFIRSLFESALKTNDALEFAVITGCLRISRESIFMGLNHLEVNSIRDNGYAEDFGFTIPETLKMLEDYGLSDRREEAPDIFLTMKIPNAEICSMYNNHVRSWFQGVVKNTDRSLLHNAIREKDTETAGRFLTELPERSISTFDCSESFYHGFLLSLLIGLKSYSAKSNREEEPALKSRAEK